MFRDDLCVTLRLLLIAPCALQFKLLLSPNIRFFTGSWGSGMAKEVVCPPCGKAIRGEHDDELVANVINHAKVHGHELGDTDRSQILSEAREI